MITYTINQLCEAGFNLINSRIDAYKILKNKTIAHGINFTAYLIFALILYIKVVKPTFTWYEFPYADFGVYLLGTFCNRQLSFDIPLNLRRHLPWYYISTDDPPKAWFDRQEIRVFGRNGELMVYAYILIWLSCLITNFWI